MTQRGNGLRVIFHSEADRTVYLQLLREYGERYVVRWWGYCLMSNHVHLVALPMKEMRSQTLLRLAHSDYARYANVKSEQAAISGKTVTIHVLWIKFTNGRRSRTWSEIPSERKW